MTDLAAAFLPPEELERAGDEELDTQLRVKLMMAESSGKLDLTDCRLMSLPQQVLRITGLEDLSLAGNCLTSLPEGIGNLTSLKRLGLAGNRLTSLPESIGQLTQLEGLWLHGNLLTSVPASLGQCTALKQLSLSGNRLTELPDAWGHMTQLDDLAVSGNLLTEVPPSLGTLPALRKLALNGNSLESLPDTLGGLVSLQELWLQGNGLTTLPDSIGDLQALKECDLADNLLTTLPATLTSLAALQKLWVYGNQLSHLPPGLLTGLPSLTQVWLEGNPGLGGPGVHQLLCDAAALCDARDSGSGSGASMGSDSVRRAAAGSQHAGGWNLVHPGAVVGQRGRAAPSGTGGRTSTAAGTFKSLGLDSQQLSGADPELVQRAARVLKLGEVQGTGRGYFKLTPSPLTTASLATTGRVPTGTDGLLPRQPVLVVALGSAPGSPNWGGLLGRLYRAAQDPAQQAFDVLYVVDPSRTWYGSAYSSTTGRASHPSLEYWTQRLQQTTSHYDHVIMLGDSMGATAGLLFAPLATHVLAFCPQVDLTTSCMRPGADDDELGALQSAVLQAMRSITPPADPPTPGGSGAGGRAGRTGHNGRTGGTCTVVALSGTWQHDLDQINALPEDKVQHRVFSLDSHRLALYLDSQGKLLPLVQSAVLGPLGLAAKTVRTANLL